MSDVTRILGKIESGDSAAAEHLLPLVYSELRKLAAARMSAERRDHTLQSTALVHEAYLRLVEKDSPRSWQNRRHFFAAASEAMRRILVEKARQKAGLRRGGDYKRVEISCVDPETNDPFQELLALDEVLEKLAAKDPRKAELVKLRFFAGLTNEQAADALGITPRTAYADWSYARSWLRVEMSNNSDA